MIPLSLKEIAAIVGGEVHGDDVVVTGAAFLDSRNPVPGGLFVAIDGEHVDGHAYAGGAIAAGAAAVLGSRPTGVPTVVVADPQQALGKLARAVLDRLAVLVVALTGSQGKTGTKDLLASLLADAGTTIATAGNLNNELGVPLTVLRADESTDYLVVEMGARGIGHIAYLCEIAPPNVAMALNVGVAHLGEFGGKAEIAQAKGEIVEALASDGTAVLNADDPLVDAMAGRTQGQVLRFGYAGSADVRIENLVLDDLGRATFDLVRGPERESVSLQGLGRHQASNAAAAATAAIAVGLPLRRIAASLSTARSASRWRMELHERADGLTVINDAYNANPDSMRAALETLSGIGKRSGRRTVAVLGEMGELGAASHEAHRALGTLAQELAIDAVVVVGAGSRPIFDALVQERGDDGSAVAVETTEQAETWLRENVAGPDVVLVKASRAAQLERVAEIFIDEAKEAST